MLVLASQSPRRREILTNAGIAFVTRRGAEVDETPRAGEAPDAYVRRLAREKAESVECGADEVVLGADTTVVVDSSILGKPGSRGEAAGMLRALSGRAHEVMTGVCLRSAGGRVEDCSVTRVWFRELTESEIEEYAASDEPIDKAGAYGIQGLASKFIPRIEGCYFNVMGLPVALVAQLLSTMRKI
jgi:septum formation protein